MTLICGLEFAPVVRVGRLVLPAIVFLSGLFPINRYLAGLGCPQIPVISVGAGVLANVVLSFVLLVRFGGAGASVASSPTCGIQFAVLFACLCRQARG